MNTTMLKNVIWLTVAVLMQMVILARSGAGSEVELAGSSAGRIVLHLRCAKRDRHYRWHWQGVVREFAKA